MKTTDLSNIMAMAWRFWRTTRHAFAECLKLAWRNFNLVRRMQTQVVRFFFQKVDSTLREAWGTLRADIVPSVGDDTRKRNDSIQVFYDTEKQAWRSYKRLNLVRFE